MRFDDSLDTVLNADAETPFGAQNMWRQLTDLIGRRRVEASPEAIERLRAIRARVPAPIRAASARGVAFADLDNDGFVDVIVGNNGDLPLLLHNGGNGNHFLNFRLVGTKTNRDAMGVRIRVVAGGTSQTREIAGGGSYLSQSDLRANFGLGKAKRAETVEINWPSGQKQVFREVEADKFYLIEEGTDQLQLQQFAGAAGHEALQPGTIHVVDGTAVKPDSHN